MLDFFKGIGDFIQMTVANFMWQDIIDIAIVAVLIYYVLKFIRDTRAAQLLKGILFLIIMFQLAKILQLQATQYLLQSTLEFGLLAVIIVFQPELRSALERLGRSRRWRNIPLFGADKRSDEAAQKESIENTVNAVANMSATKTGALIVIERETKLGEMITTGTSVDASVTGELIENIFFPKAPLHDGALIIRDGRIIAAGCLLPLTTKKVDNDLGTRHRAGIGVSEISDAIVILVSEETGIISVAQEGMLQRRLSPDALRSFLIKELIESEKEKKKDPLSQLLKGRRNNEK